jgi:hypothetical protein
MRQWVVDCCRQSAAGGGTLARANIIIIKRSSPFPKLSTVKTYRLLAHRLVVAVVAVVVVVVVVV